MLLLKSNIPQCSGHELYVAVLQTCIYRAVTLQACPRMVTFHLTPTAYIRYWKVIL